MWLRPFYGVMNAEDYLSRVEEQSPHLRILPTVPPALLPQALSYLSYVLAADREWGGGRLGSAPDLQCAASLVMEVLNDVEFRDRMSGLARVLESLHVMRLPEAVVAAKYGGHQPKSLIRLSYWLERRLPDDGSSGHAREAIADIRAAIALRNDGQHSNENARQVARVAPIRLGLPEVIWDWADAWSTVRSQLVLALDAIRQEVQMASVGE